MIVSGLSLPLGYTENDLFRAIRKKERNLPIRSVSILKKSIDARKKPEIRYALTVAVNEENPLKKAVRYETTATGVLSGRDPAELPLLAVDPVVVSGSGPAGLFAALTLLRLRIPVVLIERGDPIEERKRKVDAYHAGGELDTESNVQFGEGGAGTFSDGKLNTGTHNSRLNEIVFRTFYEFGAPEDILYDAKPHVGTDLLSSVVLSIRREIERIGGMVMFRTKLTGFSRDDAGKITEAIVNHGERIRTSAVVLAIGHSARDTFEFLSECGVKLEPKPFAIGVRIEHLSDEITKSQYGRIIPELGAAPYKLTGRSPDGRGVYSFCMCPGGYVVDASSEKEAIAVNGMSYHKRDGRNSNSAIVVQVSPEDFYVSSPLDGIGFQRSIERKAFEEGRGCVPVQRFGDFLQGVKTHSFGSVAPEIEGQYETADLTRVLPEFLVSPLKICIPSFRRTLAAFSSDDAVLSAPETRTSSPVRILRDDAGRSVSVPNLYPAGEGAGYAGGIVSSACDGVRIGESVFSALTGTER